MKALERIANNITKTGYQREFLLHMLEMFVQMGLQIRQLSEKGHRKVGVNIKISPSEFIHRLAWNFQPFQIGK